MTSNDASHYGNRLPPVTFKSWSPSRSDEDVTSVKPDEHMTSVSSREHVPPVKPHDHVTSMKQHINETSMRSHENKPAKPRESVSGPLWSKNAVVGVHDLNNVNNHLPPQHNHNHHDLFNTEKALANRRKALARRHLSNSLQGSRTVLPVLRRTQSFSSAAHNYLSAPGRPPAGSIGLVVKRDTGSLGSRKPAHHDMDSSGAQSYEYYDLRVGGRLGFSNPHRHPEAGGLRRTRSLREEGTSSGSNTNDSPSPHQLTLSLPPHPPFKNHGGSGCRDAGDGGGGGVGGGAEQPKVSLAALVHELNATVHHHPTSPSRRPDSRGFSSEDDDDEDKNDYCNDDIDDLARTRDLGYNYKYGDLDPELCPRLAGQGDNGDMPLRTLTPALRKLNKKKMPSRVRTQQWVNELENEQRRNAPANRTLKVQETICNETAEFDESRRNPRKASLIFDQET